MLSVPVIAMASISFYAGFYHLLIYARNRHFRSHLTFSILCFTVVAYDVFCVGLYNATSAVEGAQWQRLQLISLALFVPAFLWFVSDYTEQKPGPAIYIYSFFYSLAFLVQLIDRSNLTFLVDQPSIKNIVFSGLTITYYEVAFGPFSTLQSFMGLIASASILVMGFRYYRSGHRREAMPLILATGLIYVAAFHDTMVGNGFYHFIYLMEYAYLATVLMMTWSLSSTVVDVALAREELRKRDEWFRSLVETTSDWVWEVDASGKYTYASPKVRELLGYEPEEVLGRTPFDFMSPDDSQNMSRVFQNIIQNLRMFERLENINLRKDGQPVVLETSGIPFFSKEGALLGYRGIDRDVTERKKAENALKESEEKFRSIVENSLSGIFKIDSTYHFVYVNNELCRILGYPREKLLGLDFRKILSENSMAFVTDRYVRRQQGEDVPSRYELDVVRLDGRVRHAEMIVNVVNDASGKPSTMGQLVDITERKQAEEALRTSEERLQQAIRISDIGIFDHDQIADSVYWSPDIRNSYGIGLDETFTLPDFIKQIHPDDVEGIGLAIRRAHDPSGDGSFDVEYRFVRRDGVIRWFAAKSKTFFGGDGPTKHPVRTIGALIDITERKQSEEERENLIDELETKNAELERFTYTVSHDLKSPLVTIRGFLGYIEQDALSGNMERLKSDLHRISDAVEKMRQLLNDLLQLSRVGRFFKPLEVVSFDELARDAIGLVDGAIKEHHITLELQPNLPAVYGDRQRLVEVLQNLLDNASKFMGDQPHPRIEIGQYGEEGGNPILFVKDNGAGFAPEYREHIFGLFNKLDPRSEGSGIGLALVKRIIEMHGGRIWVESEKGKGATFYFTLAKGVQKS